MPPRSNGPEFFLRQHFAVVDGFQAQAEAVTPPDPPALTVTFARGVVAGQFGGAQTLPLTGSAGRARFDAFADTNMVTVQVTQTGASQATNIYAVELEARPYDLDSELE